MSATQAQCILSYLSKQQSEMLDLLEQLVGAESPSLVPEAQKAVQQHLSDVLRALGFWVYHIPGHGKSGGHLYARPSRRWRGQPFQLLLGHCDTVWPLGTLETMPFISDSNTVRGPGTFDMKGGLVQMLFAFKALHAIGLQPEVTPVVFINSDEEIGSRESRWHIERLARRACRAFVLEPAFGLDGKLKTRRKGGGLFEITVQGRSAHAGLAPEAGASAIVELSYIIQKLHALNNLERGITVNVGRIDGGLRANVVAPISKAMVDVRVPTQEEAQQVEEAIRTLTPTTPGTTLAVDGGFGRPPLEQTPRNKALWRATHAVGRTLGLHLKEGMAGGGSDGSFASLYTATLDGLGAVGDGAHAAHEFLYLDKMVERSALLALLLLLPPLATDSPAERVAVATHAATKEGPP